jgi:hypothetical protein
MPNNIIQGQRIQGYRVKGPRPLTLGEAYGGGYYAGSISTNQNGVATHYLVVSPASSGDAAKQFRTGSGADPTSSIDGPTNSATMNDASHPAAQFCEGLTIGGYSDWYMPALAELEVCFYNLKPTTDANTGNWPTNGGFGGAGGGSTYTVPLRNVVYSSGVPAQTSVADFKTGGAEAFLGQDYWASQEVNSFYAKRQAFVGGTQYGNPKTGTKRVRAIRRVAV